jgi:signal transduction histidine kinase
MSGLGTVEVAVNSLCQDSTGIVLKPFEEIHLLQVVEFALEQRKRCSEMVRFQALSSLCELPNMLFSSLDSGRLWSTIIEIIIETLHCTHVGIFSKRADSIELSGGCGKLHIDPENQLVSNLIKYIDLAQIISRDRTQDQIFRSLLSENGMETAMIASTTLGSSECFFIVGRDIGEESFNEIDLEVLGTLANFVVTALQISEKLETINTGVSQIGDSQEAIAQNRKMAAIRRLTGSFAHEINNPLQAVSNCFHLMRQNQDDDSKWQDYVNMIEDQLTH